MSFGTSALASNFLPIQVRWPRDLALTAALGVGWALPEILGSKVAVPSCPCLASSVNSLDRPYAGRDFPALSSASDIVLGGAVLVPSAWPLFGGHREDSLLILEAAALSGSLNQAFKLAVNRPRPRVYGRSPGDPRLSDPNNVASFYSGHTSTAFAAGIASARLFALRHPHSRARFWVYASALAAGSAVGILRVSAGRHFPTDVLAGATVGTVCGLAIPSWHRRKKEPKITFLGDPEFSGVTMSWAL